MFPNPLSLGMNELYRILQAEVSFEADGIRGFPNSTLVPFPSLWRQAMLMVNSFSGEEPVRAIRPMTQTGSGTFCFVAEGAWQTERRRSIF
jgi:hypothetical protein